MNRLKNIKQFYLSHKFLYNIIVLSILFFIHCFWGDMMYIVFPILAIMVCLDSLENGISYIIFCIPFCFMNIYISTLLYLACCLMYLIKFFILKYIREKRKPSTIIIILFAIFFIYCLMPIGPYNLNLSLRLLIFISLFVVLCMICQNTEIFRAHFNVKLICFSIIISSIFSLTYFFSPYLQSYLVITHASNGTLPRFMALFYHTNVLGMFCEVLLAILAYYIISKKFTKTDLILFVVLAGIGMLTFSKTYLIILVFILIVLLIWRLVVDFKRTAIITFLLAVIITAVCLIFPQIPNKVIDLFIRSLHDCDSFSSFMNMITTQRYDLWVEYAKYIFANPLVLIFGAGLGAPVISTLSPHNGYIAIIYELGIFGTTLFALTLFFILRKYIKGRKTKLHWSIFVPIVVLALIFMVEDLIFYVFQ